jgi:aspartyl-tRNA(Asn)/glutamyl-tRNA(Gln) amidotransferase subunit A
VVTTTVADAARHLDVVAGPDLRDRTSLPPSDRSYERAIEELATEGVRARWSLDLGFATVDPEVADLTASAAAALAAATGLAIDDEPVELTDPVRTWLSNGGLDLWLGIEEGSWPAVADDVTRYSRSVLEQTVGLTAPQIAKALRHRARLEREVGELFAEVDVLVTPTTAVPAFAAEGPPPSEIAGVPVGPAMATPFTMLGNLCWNPSVSVPVGLTSDGLPVGLLLTVSLHRDDLALRLARRWEQAHPWPRWA